MDGLEQAAFIIGMFILRLGIPIAITLAVGFWLRRLDTKWQAEAQARLEASKTQTQSKSTIEMFRVIDQPCWVLKACPPAMRTRCPAFQKPYQPCWMVRRQAEGQIPAECYHCNLFSSRRLPEPAKLEHPFKPNI